MKCTKCGYISFDYNQVCPRCNKKIGVDYEKFHLPSFRPDPPSLLGFLTGDTNESQVTLRVPSGVGMEDVEFDDSVILDRNDLSLDEEDLDISFEPEDSEESPLEQDELFSDSDFSLEEKEDDEIAGLAEQGEGEEESLDLGELAIEEQEEALDEPDDSKKAEEFVAEGQAYDSEESIDSSEHLRGDIDNGAGEEDEIESEIELDLDDLKLSDIGDLEIEPGMEPSDEDLEATFVDSDETPPVEEIESEGESLEISEKETEQLPNISDLMLEEEESGNGEEAKIPDESSSEDLGSIEKEREFEFGNVPLGDDEVDDESLHPEDNLSDDSENTLIIDDLDMNDSAELEKSFDLNDISIDEASMKERVGSDADEYLADSDEIDIDLDAMSLDVDEYQKGTASEDNDDIDLDLEDMDIDLDLDEPKK